VRALLLGATGQLGRELRHTTPPDVDILAPGRAELDLSHPGERLAAWVAAAEPDVVINAAAYTAVDRAESEEELAFRVNALAPAHIAVGVRRCGAHLVHVSTDYIFDGSGSEPYATDTPLAPASVYGRSKAEGERAVLEGTGGSAAVVRTSWLYSRYPPNFVLTMLRLMRERGAVRVVADQAGSPTWARNLARAIWSGVAGGTLRGVAHWSDAGATTWFDFAVAIAGAGERLGLLPHGVEVQPIGTSDYPTAAARPGYSVLDLASSPALFGLAPTPWKQALETMLEEMAVA
jgi:dTDP-4-dehydrorhamnose reductase